MIYDLRAANRCLCLTEAGLVKTSRLRNVLAESEEVLRIVVSSAKTARFSDGRVDRKS